MVIVIFLLIYCPFIEAVPFNHSIDYEHPESGEKVKLQSSGQLTNAIDLDTIDGIKRVICEESKILIATKTNRIAREWKEGQVVLGSSKWDCHLNTSGTDKKGVYVKIKSIFFPTETGIVLDTDAAGAFDVIEEADIKFHYHPGNESSHSPETRRRHRRYLSNVLSGLLRNIEWRANFSTTVPWNYDVENKLSGRSFKISSTETSEDYNTTYGDQTATDDEVFSLSCQKCHGFSVFSYSFEISITKNALNQPNINHYLSKLEANTSISIETNLISKTAMKIELNKIISETAPEVLFTIPVAVVNDTRIPKVTLTVNYKSQTHANINMTSSDAVRAVHKFKLTGTYEIVQEYTPENGMLGFVNADSWTVQSDGAKTETTKNLLLSSSVFQKINVNTTIGWFARDMEIDFSPPLEFSITPIITSVSEVDDVQRCTTDQLTVTGLFNASDARLIVDAFGVPIWNTLLAEGFNKTANITEKKLYQFCQADCFPTLPHFNGTAEDVVGKMEQVITRNDTQFERLNQFYGNSVLFASEEAETSSWCGYPGRSCVRCTDGIAGNDVIHKCADRMMTSILASSTSLLGKYVVAEWPTRKLLVHEAWDEPTSLHPHGEHGNTSLHYEGRAAIVSVSANLSDLKQLMETDIVFSERLEELAVCAGFPFVLRESDRNLVHIAVKSEETSHLKRRSVEPESSTDIEAFRQALHNIDQLIPSQKCPSVTLKPGNHWPPQYGNEHDSCGSNTYTIRRENNDHLSSLYEYSDNDVQFEDEGSLINTQCGLGRACRSCREPSGSEYPWNWCSTRTMSPRLAFRLKRLAVLAGNDPLLKQGEIKVLKAYESNFISGSSPLHNTGRALRIEFEDGLGTKGSAEEMNQLANISVCAGFDFVRYSKFGYIEVFAKDQKGFRTTLNTFPSGEVFISVSPPLNDYFDYLIPTSLEIESRKPSLIRPLNASLKLSEHFTAAEFSDKSTPYMRVDPSLVECLEMTRQAINKTIIILKAYTKTSNAKEQNSPWDSDQLERFQMGQAAVIQCEEHKNLTDLPKLLMSTCTPMLRLQRRGLSLSLHDSGICQTGSRLKTAKYCVFVGLFPMVNTSLEQYIKLTSNMNLGRPEEVKQWKELQEFKTELVSGGPQIIPYDMVEACKQPVLGQQNAHLTFKLNQIGFCLGIGNQKRCGQSTEARKLAATKLWSQLSATATTLPSREMQNSISACLVNTCGGCPDAGRTWDKKVKACVSLIDKYFLYSRKSLVNSSAQVAFFNTENANSTAHGLACKRSLCIEGIQLYNILQTTLTSRYKPTANSSIEEAVFDGNNNPSPLLEIVQQHFAMQAKGNVTVYIENIRDISALRDVLKVLMIYNRNVKGVFFKTLTGVNKEKVASDIQRKIETWAGNACPTWSRFAVSRYTVEDVPHTLVKRSIDDGRQRNFLKERQKNWEIDWIMKT